MFEDYLKVVGREKKNHKVVFHFSKVSNSGTSLSEGERDEVVVEHKKRSVWIGPNEWSYDL